MSSLYLAIGDVEDWEKYSVKKPLRLQSCPVLTDALRLDIHAEPITWDVRTACTVTHAYLLTELGEVVRKEALPSASKLRKRDTFTLSYTLHSNLGDRETPYLV